MYLNYLIQYKDHQIIFDPLLSTIIKENLIEAIFWRFNQILYERREAPMKITSNNTNQAATKLGVRVKWKDSQSCLVRQIISSLMTAIRLFGYSRRKDVKVISADRGDFNCIASCIVVHFGYQRKFIWIIFRIISQDKRDLSV